MGQLLECGARRHKYYAVRGPGRRATQEELMKAAAFTVLIRSTLERDPVRGRRLPVRRPDICLLDIEPGGLRMSTEVNRPRLLLPAGAFILGAGAIYFAGVQEQMQQYCGHRRSSSSRWPSWRTRSPWPPDNPPARLALAAAASTSS